jgi:hypothetical protein
MMMITTMTMMTEEVDEGSRPLRGTWVHGDGGVLLSGGFV